ncbi:hypothetical protein [Methylorubrum extorquens]|uniref:Uncharacterized protein n=1 Tax=Methylorubrum extorquens (strain CM4 / NCIMB 13688) TaxID=440085 RepID=B7KSW7_METC4|nr:hypothetical protein [Methylorubrum extorquens]ACK82469.1 hypothetical protein Mchl_1605 [Methylorubrum extorquens CM4]
MPSVSAKDLVRYEFVLATAKAIVSSPAVSCFCIGITGRPKARRNEYRKALAFDGQTLDGFVLLDWERTGEQAVAMERWLFERLKASAKYDNHENVAYFGSVKKALPDQAVYIAWWKPAVATS